MAARWFLGDDEAWQLSAEFGTPLFVYDRQVLEDRAREVLGFPAAFGLTARYALKALPNAAVIRVLTEAGLHIDASSGFEVHRALRAGVSPDRIQLTAQEMPEDLPELHARGVLFNACSLNQLDRFGHACPGSEVCVRINPGLGSGHSNRTNVGGRSSSFGIWHEQLPQILGLAARHSLRITRMHTHIGSGSDPQVWVHCAKLSLEIAAKLPEVRRLNLGGGFKVARVAQETPADLQEIGQKIVPEFERFAVDHGRELHLEIEPGSYLVANAGVVVARVIDVVDTGDDGHRFIKVDSGMTEVLRPSMYGAQHPFRVVSEVPASKRNERPCVIVGHCCESGDILTPEPGNAEALGPVLLPETQPGDLLMIGATGAYCSAMSAVNYNSFPAAAEVMRNAPGEFALIRRRQTLDQILENEVS